MKNNIEYLKTKWLTSIAGYKFKTYYGVYECILPNGNKEIIKCYENTFFTKDEMKMNNAKKILKTNGY